MMYYGLCRNIVVWSAGILLTTALSTVAKERARGFGSNYHAGLFKLVYNYFMFKRHKNDIVQ